MRGLVTRAASWWLDRRGYTVLPPLQAFKYEVSGPPSDTVTVDWGNRVKQDLAGAELRIVGLRNHGRRGL